MRETDIIAKEKFNGDVNAAIEYILRNCENEFINKESALWNREESNFALTVVIQIAIEKKGKKYIDNMVGEAIAVAQLDMTEDEILNAQRNPYAKKIKREILFWLIASGGITALIVILKRFSIFSGSTVGIIASVASIVTTYFAIEVGSSIVDYFRFKKAKKFLLESDSNQNIRKTQ